MCTPKSQDKRGISRRDVLRYGAAAGTAIAAMGPLGGTFLREASGAIATQNHMTIINMFGGNDSLNMVVPAMTGVDATYAGRRPTIAIDPLVDSVHPLVNPNTGNTDYVLHPQLAEIGRMYTEGDVAVFNLVGYPNPNLSHFTSEDIWSRGVRGSLSTFGMQPSGWIARYAEQYASSPTGAVSVGLSRRRDFTGGASNPLILSSAGRFRFDQDNNSNNSALRLDVVRQMLSQSAASGPAGVARTNMDQAHQLIDQTQAALTDYGSFYDPNTRNFAYSNDRPSRYLQDIARLIHGGYDTRLFYTGFGGFDTHGDQGGAATAADPNPRHARLMRFLDEGVASFAEDMKAMGVWDNTVIVVMSEFGRRCFENGSNGTDHGHGQAVFVIGGGVNHGVFGPDLTSDLLNQNWLPGQYDFRAIYQEILQNHLGVTDVSRIFPEAFIDPYTPAGIL